MFAEDLAPFFAADGFATEATIGGAAAAKGDRKSTVNGTIPLSFKTGRAIIDLFCNI